jgi:hypothetical protein
MQMCINGQHLLDPAQGNENRVQRVEPLGRMRVRWLHLGRMGLHRHRTACPVHMALSGRGFLSPFVMPRVRRRCLLRPAQWWTFVCAQCGRTMPCLGVPTP